jgi:hypothetical protein
MMNESHKLAVSTVLVFLFFAVLCSAIKFMSPGVFTTPDDPYFHAGYAMQLAKGVDVPQMPYVSTISWFGGGTLYYLYHEALALTYSIFGATDADYSTIINITKIFHAILTAVLLATYYFVTFRLIRHFGGNFRSNVALSLLSLVVLLTFLPNFAERVLFERPHIISITLLLLSIDAILHTATIRLFVLGAFFALSYSFSVIALLPSIVYLFVQLLLTGKSGMWKALRPLLTSLCGLTLGILLHPSPLHYLFNAYGAIFLALWNALTGKIIEANEIQALTLSISDAFWIIALAQVLVFFLHIRKYRNRTELYSLFYVAGLTGATLILVAPFQRAIEYFAPILTLSCTGMFVFVVHAYPREIQSLGTYLRASQKKTLVVALVLLIFFRSMMMAGGALKLPVTYDSKGYEHFFTTVRTRAIAGDKVYLPLFHTFAPAFFYVPSLRYSQGMEPTLSYLADQRLYWLSQHALLAPDRICAQRTCEQSEWSVYEVIHDEFGAKFVLIDYPSSLEGNQVNIVNKLLESLRADSRFEVFYDETIGYSHMVAFEVK